MILELKNRHYDSSYTSGEFWINGKIHMFTLEKPYKSNEPWISCIPNGLYDLIPYESKKHGKVFALENKNLGVSVADLTPRTYILIHIANSVGQLQGCIGVGTEVRRTLGDYNVMNSGKALERLHFLIDKHDISQLIIH